MIDPQDAATIRDIYERVKTQGTDAFFCAFEESETKKLVILESGTPQDMAGIASGLIFVACDGTPIPPLYMAGLVLQLLANQYTPDPGDEQPEA